jgi:sulfite exporter TauE/SafE
VSPQELLPVLTTAFLAGLLGAGHCFGMCGGIAGGLGAMATGRGAIISALVFNGARVLSYALLGGLAALLAGATGELLSLPAWGRWLRLLTILLIFLVGLRFLFAWRGLAIIEQAGAGLWSRVAPLAQSAVTRPGLSGRALLGLCWGLLPCGLVYTLLLTAASTGRFNDGFLTMLAFGLGTLPALTGMTLWAPALAGVLQDRVFRRLVGLGLVLLATWSALILFGSSSHQHTA